MKILVIGSRGHDRAECFDWLQPFPNLEEYDSIIINLKSLTQEKYVYGNKIVNKLSRIREDISTIIQTGREIFCILNKTIASSLPSTTGLRARAYLPTNYDWLPLRVIISNKRKGFSISVINHRFDEYFKHINKWRYELSITQKDLMSTLRNDLLSALSSEYGVKTNSLVQPIFKYELIPIAKNKSNKVISGTLKPLKLVRGEYVKSEEGGAIHLLPPPTKTSVEQAINTIINSLIGTELKESPPKWIKNVVIPNVFSIDSEIQKNENEIMALEKVIEKLQTQKNNKIKFLRLLWTRKFALEEIVKDAFIFLGFSEIGKLREKNLEDWIIQLQSVPDYDYGVFEVKGADKRTSLANLTQCNKWVDDYILENKKAKGIFVTNQFRLEKILDKRRSKFEPNEIDYAKTRNICILPSSEIFKAVIEKMNNNPDISRKNIEEKIASAKGLCKIV